MGLLRRAKNTYKKLCVPAFKLGEFQLNFSSLSMNHSPNCEEWFIEKMKQNGQKLVELIVIHITTRLRFTTLR